jgi:hypothetical protein
MTDDESACAQCRTPPTFDERRADPQPCLCGRLVTRPDLCVREREARGVACLLAQHPHTGSTP